MIEPEVLFSPLAIAGFVAGVVIGLIAGRFQRQPAGIIAFNAIGAGLALAAIAWANDYGRGPLLAALTVGLGATLWTIGTERGRRTTIR